MKSTYSMSEVGACPRLLAAKQLEYELLPSAQFLETAAEEGRRHEAWVVQDLTAQGWAITTGTECTVCSTRPDGTHPRGIHRSISLPAFGLVGHLDGIAEKDNKKWVLEIKSLGRFRAEKLVKALERKEKFAHEFREYAYQAACYHFVTGFPVLYAVKNRDSGKLATFILDEGFLPELEEVLDNLLSVQVSVMKGKLPACTETDDFVVEHCPVKYLHEPPLLLEVPTDLLPTVAQYRAAKKVLDEAEVAVKEARKVLLQAVKARDGKRMVVDRLSVQYVAPSRVTSYDSTKLMLLVDKTILAQCKEERLREEYVIIKEMKEMQ